MTIKQETYRLSVIIPVYNEQESLSELINRLKKELNKLKEYHPYEIIFINDGSSDQTLQKLKSFNDPLIKIVSFRRNLGKATALNIGFERATGEIIATMDGDLQDGPENLLPLLSKIDDGFDLVIGWKKKRQDSLFGKNIPSKAFNFLVRLISQTPLHDFNSGLKVMKKEVAREIFLYGELHRFIPVLAYQRGFKVAEIPVIHHSRKYGKSKYGNLSRGLRGAFDFLTVMFLHSFGERPLHLFGFLGGIGILLGMIFAIYLSILRFQGETIGNRPLLILAILLLITGLQMLLSGLIAEMLVNQRSFSDRNLPIDYES